MQYLFCRLQQIAHLWFFLSINLTCSTELRVYFYSGFKFFMKLMHVLLIGMKKDNNFSIGSRQYHMNID
jgi:hypothetical protein